MMVQKLYHHGKKVFKAVMHDCIGLQRFLMLVKICVCDWYSVGWEDGIFTYFYTGSVAVKNRVCAREALAIF